MAPKFDPNEVKYVYLKQNGGEVGSAAVLAPKIGALGMPVKKVGDDIAKASSAWKGLKVSIKLTIQNKEAKIEVIPSATVLLIKELKEPPRDRKKVKNIKHNGNLSLQQVCNVARSMQFKSLSKDFKGTVLEILGTCNSIGCTVNSMTPKEMQSMIKEGKIEIPSF